MDEDGFGAGDPPIAPRTSEAFAPFGTVIAALRPVG